MCVTVIQKWREGQTMANKRTGRPAGRPKTKEYVSLQARVPTVLADLVKRYAAQHGKIPLSVLIRDGLEWRIGDGDPRGTGLYLDEPVGIREEVYDSNTGIASSVPWEDVLQEVRTLREQAQALVAAMEHALERQRVPASGYVYSSNTENAPRVASADGDIPVASMEAQSRLGQAPAGEDTREDIPPYDRAKHHLGLLCPAKDEWGTTGQSLRNTSNQCLACKARAKREKDAKKRAGREAQPVSG